MRAAMCVLFVGCSFSMHGPPATDPGTRPVDCSESRASPIADTVGAALFWTVAVLGAAYTGTYYQDPHPGFAPPGYLGLVPAGIGGAAGALYLVAAVRGYDSAARCRQLNLQPAH